jgi:hypothetical protein
MEFVTVTFPVRRPVFMDGQPMGQTGDPLIVQPGFHDFDLGMPADYVPPTQKVNVINTTPPAPLLVGFVPALAAVGAAGPPAPTPRRGKPVEAAATAARKKPAAKKTAAPAKSAKRTAAPRKPKKR